MTAPALCGLSGPYDLGNVLAGARYYGACPSCNFQFMSMRDRVFVRTYQPGRSIILCEVCGWEQQDGIRKVVVDDVTFEGRGGTVTWRWSDMVDGPRSEIDFEYTAQSEGFYDIDSGETRGEAMDNEVWSKVMAAIGDVVDDYERERSWDEYTDYLFDGWEDRYA